MQILAETICHAAVVRFLELGDLSLGADASDKARAHDDSAERACYPGKQATERTVLRGIPARTI